jgi:hypothetical protein
MASLLIRGIPLATSYSYARFAKRRGQWVPRRIEGMVKMPENATITGVGPRLAMIAACAFLLALLIDHVSGDFFAVRGVLGVCFVVLG